MPVGAAAIDLGMPRTWRGHFSSAAFPIPDHLLHRGTPLLSANGKCGLLEIFPIAFDLSPNRHHNVFCFSPHSLHVYGTRTCPESAETRFGAPHFPHFVSIRVCPCLTVMVFRSKASFTKRSVSSRIACFDISRLLACSTAVNVRSGTDRDE